MNTRPITTRSAFVLPMTLMLIVLAAVAMAGTARRSFSKALDAKSAVDDLQRRWGARSIRAAVLPRAERILRDAEIRAKEPVASDTTELRLGALSFRITVGDEQAKLNLNRFFAAHGGKRQEVARAVSDLIHGARSGAARRAAGIRLLPHPPATTGPPRLWQSTPFRTFGQVFEPAAPDRIARASEFISCWGDGRIHFGRAEERIVRLAARKLLPPAHVDRLLAARAAILRERREEADDERPFALPEVREALVELQLNRQMRQRILSQLVDASACHSLWIVARSERRTWHEFAVTDTDAAQRAAMRRFTWTP